MARGGQRNGAGRKKGSVTKKTVLLAQAAAAEGLTPLQVMLKVMRKHYEDQQFDRASSIAKDAAPYVHPRLASVTLSGDADAPLEIVVRRLGSRASVKDLL